MLGLMGIGKVIGIGGGFGLLTSIPSLVINGIRIIRHIKQKQSKRDFETIFIKTT